jgi:tripartite-type tricarboxylate transporter receptor subunit TctC
MSLRRSILGFVLAAAATTAAAQEYPTKPIKIIVPFPPAGGTDILGRTVANKLGELNKWSVIVDNKPGAGGNIGVDTAAKSPPDGYTLVMGQTSNLAISPSLYAKLPYDPVKDLVPVILVGSGPVALVVRADSPYRTLGDLIAAAKAKPGSITMASPGNGTVAHLSGVRLQNVAGVKFEHIPYKGAGAAIPDILGGSVDIFLSSVPTLQSHVAGGKMRALAVTSPKRSAVMPTVPTIAETYKGFDSNTWFGILAPAGTPRPVIAKLNAEINKVLADPDTRQKLVEAGAEVDQMSIDQFRAFVDRESAKYARIIKETGVTAD